MLENMDGLLRSEVEQQNTLKHDVCSEGECCCKCKKQLLASICNCRNDWPEKIIFLKSNINPRHGYIGWACMAFAGEGVVEIIRNKHSSCEEFEAKGSKKKRVAQ